MPKLHEVNVDVGLLQALFVGLVTLVVSVLLGLSWLDDRTDRRVSAAVSPLKEQNTRLEMRINEMNNEFRSSLSTIDSSKNRQYGELRSLLLELRDGR